MEAKEKEDRLSSNFQKRKALSVLQEFKEELKKVTWTTKAELLLCTKIVLGSIFIFGLGIYVMDLVVKGVLDGLKSFVFLIFR